MTASADAPVRARLPLRFDSRALEADVDALRLADWVPHFNTGYYEGDWSGAALRSVNGDEGRLYPDPTEQAGYADTPLLGRCPAARAALDAFHCPLLSARFLRVGPGSRIREHTDYNLGAADGEIRVHVPVTTGPGVEFHHHGEVVEMAAGEAWYMDLNLKHSVVNDGPVARVHLVIDCVVDDWLREVLDEAFSAPETRSGRGNRSTTTRARVQNGEWPS